MTKLAITVEQGSYFTQIETNLEIVNAENIAVRAVNAVMIWAANNRILATAKERVKLNKPFTFSLQVESEGKEALTIPSFSSKIGMSEDSIQKLVENMPYVVNNLLLPMDMQPLERLKAVKDFKTTYELKSVETLELLGENPQ